jgi:hypothetical protein
MRDSIPFLEDQMTNTSKGRGAKVAAPKKRTPWLLIIGAGALLLALAGALLLLRPAPPAGAGGAMAAPAAGSGPRLAVDQEKLDLGDVSFEQPVVATFHLTNTGDAPLQIVGEPVVAVISGC